MGEKCHQKTSIHNYLLKTNFQLQHFSSNYYLHLKAVKVHSYKSILQYILVFFFFFCHSVGHLLITKDDGHFSNEIGKKRRRQWFRGQWDWNFYPKTDFFHFRNGQQSQDLFCGVLGCHPGSRTDRLVSTGKPFLNHMIKRSTSTVTGPTGITFPQHSAPRRKPCHLGKMPAKNSYAKTNPEEAIR